MVIMCGSEINTMLDSFSPIALEEMDGVMLMNRLETKYVFSTGKLPKLLNELEKNYKVLEINNVRSMTYHTTYLDSPEMFFFYEQIRGKLNRHKIRYRKYETSGDSFLEIKKKTNKDRTIKWRIASSISPVFDQKELSFIIKHLPLDASYLEPSLINGFIRITLVGKEIRERITLDYDIKFSVPGGSFSELPFLAIAEVKREKMAGISPFVNSMKQFGIRPGGFSKYCMGTAIMKDIPRINNLKQQLLLLNKLENEFINHA